MFTQCPKCKSIFRVYAEQLAQAHGQVRCGICDHGFNALDSLTEHLGNFAVQDTPAAEPAKFVEQPEDVGNDTRPQHTETPSPTPLEPGISANSHLVATSNVTVSTVPSEAISAQPAVQAEDNWEPATLSDQHDGTLPDLGIIAAEPRRQSPSEPANGALKTALWTIANISLIVVLLGQYAYFNRNDLSQYPELRPWLTRFCALVSCNTPLRRDVSHINLVNRIVQSHPTQPNALLIDATLVNAADFPQPYPLLEIRFTDLNNQLVAGRRFRPGEYLPADTPLQAGMPPHQPVHISLEIVDPGKEAVSFQFELL